MQRHWELSRRTSKYAPQPGCCEAKRAHIAGSDVEVERMICFKSPHSEPTPTILYSEIEFRISEFYVLKREKFKINI